MLNEGDILRLGHFSDLHYSPGNLAEADRCFGFAVHDAIAANCHAGIVSGDSTDHRLDAHTPAYSTLARRIHQLSAAMPVLMLQGTYSHEPPGMLDLFRLIGARYPVYVADRIHQVALCNGEFVPSKGPIFSPEEVDELLAQRNVSVLFTCVPTVNKAVLASATGVANAATAIGDHLAAYMAAAGAVNRKLRTGGIRTVGVSHGTVNGCETEHGVPMAGFDHEFSIGALFEADCDAFMLGHIHRAQQWEREGRVAAYAGSIGRFHYGEIGSKGYLQWQVAPGHAVATQVQTPARETVCIDFDGPPDMETLAIAAAEAEDKFVRIRWSINEEHRQLVDREAILALFSKSAEVKCEARVIPAVRSRADGISRMSSLPEKLAKWGELTNVDIAPLVERLAVLQADDPQSIADSVLAQLREANVPVARTEVIAPQALLKEMEDDTPPVIAQPEQSQVSTQPALDWLADDLFA